MVSPMNLAFELLLWKYRKNLVLTTALSLAWLYLRNYRKPSSHAHTATASRPSYGGTQKIIVEGAGPMHAGPGKQIRVE